MLRPSGIALSVLFLAACTDISEFAASPDEPYTGRVLGADGNGCDAGPRCSFLRRGFPSTTELRMTFDPTALTTAGGPTSPGTLTSRSSDEAPEPCGTTFDQTPLYPIEPLFHDALSQYDFPGGGRVKNYIFALRPTAGPLAGRDAMAFVSLLREGRIELRVVAGGGGMSCDPTDCAAIATGECDFFGVFPLRRMPSP